MLFKKVLLIGGLSMICQAAVAVDPDKTVEYGDGSYYSGLMSMPQFASYNGEQTVYLSLSEEAERADRFRLFNSDFEGIGTIEFHVDSLEWIGKFTFNRPIIGRSYDYMSWGYGWSLDQCRSAATENGSKSSLSVKGGYYFYFPNDQIPGELSDAALVSVDAVKEYVAVNEFCDEYWVAEKNGSLYDFIIYRWSMRSYEIIRYSDEILEENVSWGYVYEDVEYLRLWNFDTSSDSDHPVFLTQTLFNKDDDYEALIPVYSIKEEPVGEWSHRYHYNTSSGEVRFDVPATRIDYKPVLSGYNVVKPNGEVVTTFSIPEELQGSDFYGGAPTLYLLGGNKYFSLSKNGYILLYDMSQSAAVKSPMLVEKVKIHPAVVNQGENINVEVSDNDEISMVTLTDMKGATRRVASAKGSSRATINTSSFARGMHVVGVETEGDSKIKTQKVIIR